jgi:photosystem II stability/assembly factor-like uncharacterized protein
MNLRRRKSTRIALLSAFFSIAVALFLTACGSSAPSQSASTTTTSTITTSSATPTSATGASGAPTNTTSVAQIDPLQAIRMVDTSNGWALTTKNAVLKTSDGGRHWQNVTLKIPVTGKYTQGEFLTAQVAWLAWQATPGPDQPITIAHTSNGGASWQSTTINNITGGLAQDTLRFINPQQGWLATTNAEGMMHYTTNFYHTIDGGQTWTNVSGPTRSTSISGISFSGPQLGWTGLYWPGTGVQVQKTVNGGKSWQQLQLPIPAGINSQQIGQTQTNAPVLIGVNGLLPAHITYGNAPRTSLVLYTTHNSGATWIAGTIASFDSSDVYALDTQRVWAEETHSNTLHFSSDGGKTWSQLAQTPAHFGALSFVDIHNGWSIDDAGDLYQTTNGGTGWQKLSY